MKMFWKTLFMHIFQHDVPRKYAYAHNLENYSEICKKLERLLSFKAKPARKCAKNAFMLIFEVGTQ